MAEALISKLVEMLASNIGSQIEQKYNLITGVESEVNMLRSNLEGIQAVLTDAENKQMKEQQTIGRWLTKLKGISYDIDDVLDEWSTEILKAKVEGDEYEYAAKRSKVWFFFRSFCFCLREVGVRRDIAVKITELNERLDVIAKEKDRYNLSFIQSNEHVIERSVTTSFVDVKEVKGRENDQYALLDLLLGESSEMPNLGVISVVGMGGIGKTTFAKLVYNEDRVKSHFEYKIWICVSDPFDETRIAKEILESLQRFTPDVIALQILLEKIQRLIQGKKFLLVMDDVWNDNFRKWEQLKCCLECGAPGSKILITTRKESVAQIMNSAYILHLGILSDEECWEIFSKVAFFQRSRSECIALEEIGRKLVSRCKGLPLAVKTIASLLRFKKSKQEWQNVLESKLWKLEEVEKHVLVPLWLSYIDLPSPLKQCFSYCAIFPKDYKMYKNKLIELWIAQGYIREIESNNDLEMIGEGYFNNLVMRYFLQDVEEKGYGKDISCRMHDIVHDFAQSTVKSECCSIEVNRYEKEARVDLNPNEIRHAGIELTGSRLTEVVLPSWFCNLRKLRSLVVLSGYVTITTQTTLSQISGELICLRSLDLSNCRIREIPNSISRLFHLRQLDLSCNPGLEMLPETICQLYNLQTLNVNECVGLGSLPRGIEKLIKLRCLYNYRCSTCLLPKGIGKLSGLRRLSWIKIGEEEEEEETNLSLRDIKKLNNLGGELFIWWRRQHKVEVDVKEAKEAQLKEKKNLSYLSIWFSCKEGGEWRKEEDEELLGALEPCPTNLKSLRIENYQGRCSPSWISSMTFLRQIVLSSWRNCEQLPNALGKLPSLESLEIEVLIV